MNKHSEEPKQTKLTRLSVIIPVYNEASTISEVLKRVLGTGLPIEAVLVDDHSSDGTGDILRSLEKDSPNFLAPYPGATLKFVYKQMNEGKGASLRTGIALATGEITIIQDADMEYDPADYEKVIAPILAGEADVVYGSRFMKKQPNERPWHTFGNKFLTACSNWFTGLRLTDMETCYKAFKTPILQSLPIRSNRFGFEPEITAKVAKLGCAIDEVPISYHGRTYAEGKKIGWKDGVSALATIVRFWWTSDLGNNGTRPPR